METHRTHKWQSFEGILHLYGYPKYHAPLSHCIMNKEPAPNSLSLEPKQRWILNLTLRLLQFAKEAGFQGGGTHIASYDAPIWYMYYIKYIFDFQYNCF